MRFQPVRVIPVAAFALLATVTVAACSSGNSSSGASASASAAAPTSAAPTSAAPTTSSSGSNSAATAQIKANWEAFFNPKTPVSKRVSLLQNGSTFASIIQSQASSSLASSATSSVSLVTIESPSQAKVKYSILVGGTPALNNQPGVAVYQDGIWKVGDQSFCALLTLENSGKAPSACASAAG
jgi:hypothetical protein